MRRMRTTGVSNRGETLGICDYCEREGRARNLTQIIFDENNVSYYCPRCLPLIADAVKGRWDEDPFRRSIQRKKDALD